MFRMEIDSSPESDTLTPMDRILQRLDSLGVPAEKLDQLQPGLVAYVKNNKSQTGDLVSALLPTNEEAIEAITERKIESPESTASSSVNVKALFEESVEWIQWLMFDGEPSRALEQLADTGQRGVCGAVWGNNDIAYRCRTCEHDPTCAICVPCFQNGNHKDHDYSIIYTGGGCCDCGDVTAWKREGFCSKHKGAEQIQPLPEEFANSMGPVLDLLLSCWRKRLLFPESISGKNLRGNDHSTELKLVIDELTSAVVEMLLKFCKHSESLLSFISRRVSSSAGLLDILVRAEKFMIGEENVKKIHELLLKLLGEPQFKYEFAKVFLSYYPTVVNEAIREGNDIVFNKYPLLSTFSVQIFTVPTLTPRLVKEMNLLPMLLGCLGDILVFCAGEDGKLQGFSAFIMEHALRIRVFCAQVQAGMWRRNGDVAILSCEWYRSVRWSEQGLELDLFLLQCCAALAPADLYISRIVERFELSNYLSFNLERPSEYEPALVQEMLTLIIQIVKERRFCGLTSIGCLQKELVYRLSIGDATHSQLVKSLPRDLSKIDKFQEILDRIAMYSNPSGMNQGMYKLRLPYWKELDLYHPRWNSRDLQVAEERYMRFCNVSALTTQLPGWSKIYPPLGHIAEVATCRTVLQIVRAVVSYAVFSDASNSSRAPDGVLLRALHLLSLALDICHAHRESGECSFYKCGDVPILALACEEIPMGKFGDQSLLSLLVFLMRKHKKENYFVEAGMLNLSSLVESLLKKFAELQPEYMKKLQDLAPDLVNQLSRSFPSVDTNSFKSFSESDKRKAKARERQAAILEKMRVQQSKFLASIDSTTDVAADDSKLGKELCDSGGSPRSEEATPVICSLCHDPNSKSPVSYLIFLQKSRLLSLTNKGPPSWEQTRRPGKEPTSRAKEVTDISYERSNISRSSEIISSSWLNQFIQNKVNEFALEGQPKEVEAFLEYIKEKFPSVKNIQPSSTSITVKEKASSSFEMLEEHMYSLIREEMDANSWDWVLLKNDRKLSALGDNVSAESLLLGRYISALSRECSPSASMNNCKAKLESSVLLPTYNGFGPSDCDGVYLSSCGHAVHQGCLDRYLSSLKERYTRRIVFEGGHILDPNQGEFLCPVCRGLANSVLPALPADTKRSTQSVSTGPSDAVGHPTRRFQEALFLLQSAADVAGSREILQSRPLQQLGQIRVNLESVVRVLCEMYFLDKDKISESGRLSHSLILFDTLKYSLVSTEIAARSGKTSLAPNYSLGALYKDLKSSNCFILALLLSIVQNTRTKDSLTVMLRLRGIQLFAESICSGTSTDEPAEGPTVGGNMQDILEFSETDLQYPDIQFWKQASDPILAHDAFSSLMWVLYCLPCPFLLCEDSFLSLVHLFYVVTITQTVITYCRKLQTSLTESGCSDSLVTDIYRTMEEYGVAYRYFDSNHIDAHDVKDAIRSLSFPYLRRCALLWKLVRSSISVPFGGGSNIVDGLPYSMVETMECGENIAVEFNEIEKLEKLFKIPHLMIWLRRFSKQFEAHRLEGVMYSTPAVPFKLMLLPHLYQDLLQRYIKQHCPDCGVVPEEPALCLLCGRLCSPNWKLCCRESGSQTHAMVCGAGTGVFLLIRKTTVLLQRSARQFSWPSPYLDAFGEEDTEMQRGKPLYLNEERYAALTHMVASHGIDCSPKVVYRFPLSGPHFVRCFYNINSLTNNPKPYWEN
ncbi:unnamed protein product [Withania somnifera]